MRNLEVKLHGFRTSTQDKSGVPAALSPETDSACLDSGSCELISELVQMAAKKTINFPGNYFLYFGHFTE